jgi:acid phosphatase type 7
VLEGFLRDGHASPSVAFELRAYWAGRIRRESLRPTSTLILFAALGLASAEPGDRAQPSFPTLLAAGDIASCMSDGDERTAELLDSHPGLVLTLGDNAYERGTLAEFRRCFGPSWGRHKRRIRPSPGNHEYESGGSGYFSYFGAAAGPGRRGYYSFDLGRWHIVSLNSERDTRARGAQVRWLRSDLARTSARCVLAFWHRPRWSGGERGGNVRTAPLWNALYAAGADVVLAGHDHNYQRFLPLDGRGRVDRARGIRSFVVGTGGRSFHELRRDRRRSAANDQTLGILRLILRPAGYTWEFLPASSGTYRDTGSGRCSPR